MVLLTHILFTLLLLKLFNGNFFIILPLSFFFHYILDFVPHWEYDLKSLENRFDRENRKFKKIFLFDFLKVFFDFATGIFLFIFMVWHFSDFNLFLSAIAGLLAVFSDFLQFVFYYFKAGFLVYHQKFHNYLHFRFNVKKSMWNLLFVLQVMINVAFIFIFIKM